MVAGPRAYEGRNCFSGGRVCEDRSGAQARWCPALLPLHPWRPGQPGLLALGNDRSPVVKLMLCRVKFNPQAQFTHL